METGLDGRVALVTGGSGGIGQAVALALAAEGAQVAVTYHHNEEPAGAVVSTVDAKGGTARAFPFDLATEDSARQLLGTVTDALGAPGVVVANAVRWPAFDDEEIAGLRSSLQDNAVGSAAVIDAALPAMRDAGWGRVVVVSTDIVEQPLPGPLAYASAKGALEAAARVLAVREASNGILTNTVRPGFTLTDRARNDPRFGDKVIDQESRKTPTGRICTPEDVAAAVVYLGSQANGHVNGQVLSVAGGRELVR